MTTAVRSPLGPREPLTTGGSNIRKDNEIGSFKARLTESRARAAGQPALGATSRFLFQAPPLAEPTEGLARPGCGPEVDLRKVWEEPTIGGEEGGDPKVDDRHSLGHVVPSAGY